MYKRAKKNIKQIILKEMEKDNRVYKKLFYEIAKTLEKQRNTELEKRAL